ncbi:hypothetical protein H9X87_06230 [Pseudoflavonifractor capillosus]|uniref:hypothetical protein n=1 Tax=Pseudoflavonifractor capillosus TaxID=106588 RepID=UPI00195E60B5|nr:hypothetical protein [Pseudoflavonifractor capillosus]MBM6694357.1 hypothetical protein [Pseudoflavonifractor capillosus]
MEKEVVVTLTDYEQRILVRGMNEYRNQLLKEEKPTEDVARVMLKVIQAKPKKKGLLSRETR